MNTIGEEILKLRQEGFNYNEIASKVNCSKATVSYYCSPGQKEKVKKKVFGVEEPCYELNSSRNTGIFYWDCGVRGALVGLKIQR